MCVSNFAHSSLLSCTECEGRGFLSPRLLSLYLPTSKSNFAILVASPRPPIVDGGPLYSLAPHGGGGCLVSPPPLLPHVERSQATERNKRGFPFALVSLSLSPLPLPLPQDLLLPPLLGFLLSCPLPFRNQPPPDGRKDGRGSRRKGGKPFFGTDP